MTARLYVDRIGHGLPPRPRRRRRQPALAQRKVRATSEDALMIRGLGVNVIKLLMVNILVYSCVSGS